MSAWSVELWRIFFVCLAAVLAGLVIGFPTLFVFFALVILLAFHIHKLHQLETWLREGNPNQPPDVWGVWGNIYFYVYRLQKRYLARKKKLASIVKQFKQSTSAMPDGAVVLNGNGEIAWFNHSAKQLLGLKSPQDVGLRLVNLVRSPQFYAYILNADFSQPIEIASPAEGDLIVSLKMCPYGDNQYLLLVRDITKLHMLEAMRRDFISNISHELRTPLTVLKGSVETMELGNNIPEHWIRPLALVSEQTMRMDRLLNDLLLLSRVESAPRPDAYPCVNIPELLQSVVNALRVYKGCEQNFVCDVDASLWMRATDSEIRSVMSNLITNAIRYSPAGYSIQVRWYYSEQGMFFEVEDQGEGILPEFIPRITERFFRIDEARSRKTGGTGLGLAIVKHVMDLYHGELHVDSKIGVGSLFRCSFPLALSEKHSEGEIPPNPPFSKGGTDRAQYTRPDNTRLTEY